MKPTVAIVAAALSVLTACGYRDDNRAAVRVTAQALLDAERAHDADGVCLVLGPVLLASTASQGGGRCQPYVQRTFEPDAPALRVARVTWVNGDERRARAAVQGRPDIVIRLIKDGSTWRVEETSVLTPR